MGRGRQAPDRLLPVSTDAGLFNSWRFTMMTFPDLRDLTPAGLDAGCIASASAFASPNSTLPGEEPLCNFGSVAVKSDLRARITARGAL